MTPPELKQRVTALEEELSVYRDTFKKLQVLPDQLAQLNRSISEGHFCKWNTEMGALLEFKTGTPEIRSKIFRTLEQHDERMDSMDAQLTELNTGKKILQNIEQNQITAHRERIVNLIGVISIILLFIVSVFGNDIRLVFIHAFGG